MDSAHLARRYRAARWAAALLAPALVTAACRPAVAPPAQEGPASTVTDSLTAKIRRFVPVPIGADTAALPASEREALRHLVAAGRALDGLFLDQVWAGNTSLLLQLAADGSPTGRAELQYFLINKGPWSRLDANEPFVRPVFGVPDKPPQANFYPADATRDEVDQWIGSLTGAAHRDATSFYSVIRRDAAGRLTSVPYSVVYRNQLVPVRDHLLAAARATTNASLEQFLELRAAALLSNDYYDSDVAWLGIDAAIEPTIGPYETYEDEWFGYKAAFEAFIALRDDAETARLASFANRLQAIENALPIDPRYRNPSLGALAPIRVVNLVYASGDGNRGVQTAAFNLPNDDRIIREHGAKRVMLKNVQEAKFAQVLVPIARVALQPADTARVSFDAFFTHILMHELMHGLGPHQVATSGMAVRLALKDTYAPLEEAKADISGLWALHRLAGEGAIDSAVSDALFTTFLASTFRSLRFGLNEAHGKGIALQLNFLLDQGAVVVHDDGTFGVEPGRMASAINTLTGEIMTIQAEGDYAAAQALLARYAEIRPPVQRVLDQLVNVPVDIAPEYDDGVGR